MSPMIKDATHKIIIGLVSLWFWSAGKDQEGSTLYYVYSDHLGTNHERLQGKRIRVEIAIVDE